MQYNDNVGTWNTAVKKETEFQKKLQKVKKVQQKSF